MSKNSGNIEGQRYYVYTGRFNEEIIKKYIQEEKYMSVKVSVIVPVYNAQQYLVRCLGNLLHQTLKDIELILINDASTDNSLNILMDSQKQFPDLVKVIDLPYNKGPGGARNAGIKAATGEYIGFVDSDDCVDVTMYEKLYKKAIAENCDIVDCGFIHEKKDQAVLYTSDQLTGELNIEKRKQLIVTGGYLWSKIFRREIIVNDSRYIFRENSILEDSEILTYAFATVKRIGNVKEILYRYTYQNISASNTMDPYKYYSNIYNAMEAVYQALSSLEIYSEIQSAVEYEIIQMFYYGILMCLKQANEIEFNSAKKIDELQQLKKRLVQITYEDNPYIKMKFKPEDYEILKQF